jgi:hypothetical protein
MRRPLRRSVISKPKDPPVPPREPGAGHVAALLNYGNDVYQRMIKRRRISTGTASRPPRRRRGAPAGAAAEVGGQGRFPRGADRDRLRPRSSAGGRFRRGRHRVGAALCALDRSRDDGRRGDHDLWSHRPAQVSHRELRGDAVEPRADFRARQGSPNECRRPRYDNGRPRWTPTKALPARCPPHAQLRQLAVRKTLRPRYVV